jgi:hypothetical protein
MRPAAFGELGNDSLRQEFEKPVRTRPTRPFAMNVRQQQVFQIARTYGSGQAKTLAQGRRFRLPGAPTQLKSSEQSSRLSAGQCTPCRRRLCARTADGHRVLHSRHPLV